MAPLLRTTAVPLIAAVWLSSPSTTAPAEEAKGSFEALHDLPPAILIEGSPGDRGRAYGKLFQSEIRRFLEKEILEAFAGKPASKDEMLRYADACGEVVREECPMIAEELRGIAEGSGLGFEEVLLINLHEELYHRADLPGPGHCTAVAVAPPDTGDSHTYVGQTWDWMESVAGQSRVLEWRRAEGASVLAYGFPGMPMGAGLNSEGIALSWTSAALEEKGLSPRIGIPSYVLIAHLLAQKDLDGVIRAARRDKHAGWFTFVMADGCGRLLNVEGSPRGIVVEEAKGRLARVGYGASEAASVLRAGPVSMHPRCRKMYDLFEASRGKNGLGRLQEYFAAPGFEINAGKATIDMMVFDTTARAAHVSRGSSYKTSWRKFAFGPASLRSH